jgi:hypothetical protein
MGAFAAPDRLGRFPERHESGDHVVEFAEESAIEGVEEFPTR